MKKLFLAAALGSAALIAGTALAQDDQGAPRGRMPGMGMMRADANHDGVLTRDEATAQADRQFARLDTNNDGRITHDELDALRDAMGGAGGPPPPPPPGAQPMPQGGGEMPPPPPPPGGGEGGRAMRDGRGGGMGGALMRADADGDGTITRDEFRAASLKRFNRMDANHDGRIDKAEMDAMRDMMPGGGRGMGRGQRGQGGDMPPPPPPGDDAGQ